MHDIEQLVDTACYPIHEPESPRYETLITQGRLRLKNDAVFSLPGFIRTEILDAMQCEARALIPAGYHKVREREAIGRNVPYPTRVSSNCIGLDQMFIASRMRSLFFSDALTSFIGALLNRHPYYRTEDPMASCMITALGVDDELGWHFDSNDGVVTLMLEHSDEGGLFEFVANARDLGDVEFEKILTNTSTAISRLKHEAGALTLFNGHRALHRVSPVASGPARLTLIFSYDSEPGQIFSESVRRGFFGRIEPLPTPP